MTGIWDIFSSMSWREALVLRFGRSSNGGTRSGGMIESGDDFWTDS